MPHTFISGLSRTGKNRFFMIGANSASRMKETGGSGDEYGFVVLVRIMYADIFYWHFSYYNANDAVLRSR